MKTWDSRLVPGEVCVQLDCGQVGRGCNNPEGQMNGHFFMRGANTPEDVIRMMREDLVRSVERSDGFVKEAADALKEQKKRRAETVASLAAFDKWLAKHK